MQAATKRQIALLHHTLGLRPEQREGHRNHFVAGPGHHDMPDLEALVQLGLMTCSRTPAFCDPGDIVFRTTDAGRTLAIEMLPEPPPPVKHTQHRQWLDADTGFSFGEWLCGGQLPKFETRGHCGYGASSTLEYRMYRMSGYGYGTWCDVEGQWAKTKKEAKASYKAALKASKAQSAAAHKGSDMPTALQRKTAQVLAQVPISERGICGYTKDGHHFQVEREEDSDRFYIIVKAPCGSTCYDGWWPNTDDEAQYRTLESAVSEAINGAGLLPQAQKGQA